MVRTSVAALVLGWAMVGVCSTQTGQAAQAAQAGRPTTELQEGRRLYQAKCAVCHVPATRQAEPYGPGLSKRQVATNEDTDTARKAIENGGARMPGFQHALNPSQISAIIAFLKTLDSPPDRIVVDTPNAP